MNSFSDHGIVISLRPHGENGAIVSCLTENHGRVMGYVNGAQSSARLKSTLQRGNIISVDWEAKTEGQLGRFDIELETDLTAVLINNPKALLTVQSLCGLLNMFLPEREKSSALFHGSAAFFDLLRHDPDNAQWPYAYIAWEMAFLKELGYGIDLSQCTATSTTENLTHVSPKSGRAVCAAEAAPYASKLLEIPHFLRGEEPLENDIVIGLKMTGYFLIHRLLQHSTYHALPDARIQLENSFG